MRIGVLADTHGVLRDEVLALVATVDHLIHAGDVGAPEVLEGLRAIAPVTAVRGNVDVGAWGEALPETATIELAGARIHVAHDRSALAIDPVREGVAIVITGHSHRASIEEKDGVLYVNPGGCGRRRFSLPLSIAMLEIDRGEVRDARIVAVAVTMSARRPARRRRP
jgi:putative phosphoesterase